MKKRTSSHIFSAAILFTLALLSGACFPRQFDPPPPTPPGLELTVTAQSLQLQAFTQTALATQSQPIIIVVTATPDAAQATATSQPAAVEVPTNTPSPAAITVTVSGNTNCRLGPGQSFADVFTLMPGQVAEVVGKDTFDNYWIIKVPDGSGKTCWLWGQYATVTGDVSSLTELATPTAVAGKPIPPAIVNSVLNCVDLGNGSFKFQVGIDWQDNSNNETGFNIQTNAGNFAAAANSTHTDLEVTLPAGSKLKVVLKAENAEGTSGDSSKSFVCP